MSSHTNIPGTHALQPAVHQDTPAENVPYVNKNYISEDSLMWGGTHNKQHSITYTPVSISWNEDQHLAYINSSETGVLKKIKQAADTARATFSVANPKYSIPKNQLANSESAKAVLKSGGGTFGPYYRRGNIHANCWYGGTEASQQKKINKTTHYNSPQTGRTGAQPFTVEFSYGGYEQHINSENSPLGVVSLENEILPDTGYIVNGVAMGMEYDPSDLTDTTTGEKVEIKAGQSIKKDDIQKVVKRLVKISSDITTQDFNIDYTGKFIIDHANQSHLNTSHSDVAPGSIQNDTSGHTNH